MKEIERRALMGDKESQKECTENGIVLPCPWCKNVPKEEDVFPYYAGWIIYHDCKIAGHMRIKAKTRFNLILKWNTRPAPPIGRCKDCQHLGERIVHETGQKENFCNHEQYGLFAFDSTEAYCSYFEPKEEGNT